MIDNNKEKLLRANINNWKSMLLDLTLKNKALNIKTHLTKSLPSKLKIIHPSFDDLCNTIENSQKETFQFGNYETVHKYTLNQYGNDVLYSHNIDDILKQGSLKSNTIYSEFGDSVFLDVIKKIEKNARTFKEEYSIDIAYLTFGILKWYESIDSNLPIYAPLLFYPVEIKKDNSNNWKIIRKLENGFIFNESLARRMKNDFKADFEYIDIMIYQIINFKNIATKS
ncbi:DUF4011 domain-containing protein [Ureaplasma diversum]|uniref:DUF4011 domain-containing protein n=1 Tax=Ureaplasma diversum TaxID=42094 RepID=UPI000A407358|nr:DUF4011 domain-containing protein [Ureaplasma diversum]